HRRVASFGIAATAVFGNDVAQVYRALEAAATRARAGQGPSFIEAYTYRWNGHVGPENDEEVGDRYPEEIAFWKTYCPIELLERALESASLFCPDERKRALAEIEAEIQDAFAFARASAFPSRPDWQTMNFCPHAPLADRLLHDAEATTFDQ